MSSNLVQLVRYGATGLGLYVVDFCTFFILVSFVGVHPALAQLVARAAGAAVGFVGHRHFTFKETLANPQLGLVSQGSAYALVSILTIVSSPFLISFALALTNNHTFVSKLIIEPLLILMSYTLLKYVFREKAD